MAAGPFVIPDKAKLNFFNATNLLGANAANFKLALLTSAWTPSNTTDEVWADMSANEIAAGNGYTAGGIALTGVALSLIPAQTVSSITKSGQTATVTTGSAHGLSTGMQVPVSGATDPLYNGTFPITVTGATTFTYTMTGTPAANASGSLAYGGVIKFTCNNAQWTASGGSIPAWRRGEIYYNGTLNGKVNPIVGHFLGDSTPADVPATTSSNTLTVTPNAAGIVNAA